MSSWVSGVTTSSEDEAAGTESAEGREVIRCTGELVAMLFEVVPALTLCTAAREGTSLFGGSGFDRFYGGPGFDFCVNAFASDEPHSGCEAFSDV